MNDCRRETGLLALLAGSWLLAAPMLPLQAEQLDRPSAPLMAFDIPAMALDEALIRFATQSATGVFIDGVELGSFQSRALAGRYPLQEGLRLLLADSGFAHELVERAGVMQIRVYPLPQTLAQSAELLAIPAMELSASTIDALREVDRHTRAHDDVYDRAVATAYKDRQAIERFQGSAPADLFKGMLNVFSGDARNSGALDPNVRGIQGPGRVPLTIDGTEQALTVYRGQNGASNRNYIDANLLSSLQVFKGPNLERNVRSGVGGAVVARTLEVEDILADDQDWGGELKLEGSDNGVSPHTPRSLSGLDYREVEGFPANPAEPYADPSLRFKRRSGDGPHLLSGENHAYRLALGKRDERFEWLAAYAYREQGNHFSGKHKAGYYSRALADKDYSSDFVRSLALLSEPGSEVGNTSMRQESWLLKGTLKFSDEQRLKLGIRDTRSVHGEILPYYVGAEQQAETVVQWPLSHIEAQAYNLEYQWQPADNPWLDILGNLWMTRTGSDTYSAGGFPNWAHGPDSPYLIDTAKSNARNTRVGVTLSNRMELHERLDLTLGGSYQHETLRSDDAFLPDVDSANFYRQMPREGRRQEHELNFKFDWKPLNRLDLSVGARYSSYWAFDDFLAQQQRAGTIASQETAYRGRAVSYDVNAVYTQADWDSAYSERYDALANRPINPLDHERADLLATQYANYNVRIGGNYVKHVDTVWLHDGKGNYSRVNNPCINGSLAGQQLLSECLVSAEASAGQSDTYNVDTTARYQRGHAWAPQLSASLWLTDDSRLEFRYSEAVRYPSIFESTLAFSASPNLYGNLKPEHARDYELAYVHDLGNLFASARADLRLAYYQHETREVIDRNADLRFVNLEQQTIRGVELQGRYDNGRTFLELGVAHTFENRVCDENSAMRLDPYGSIPDCVRDGFVGGYLLTQIVPRFSANVSAGRRFLSERLELGGRVVYYQRHDNPELGRYYGLNDLPEGPLVNFPYGWDTLTTLDAYASYKARDNIRLELIGTNLTDRFYLDPGARSLSPAPGRALRLAFTANF